MDSNMIQEDGNVSAELLFEKGLDHYDHGEWDQAKTRFVQGIKVDPAHVDLQVHAGLSELLEGNHDLALARFDCAVELGRQEIDRFIAENPDETEFPGEAAFDYTSD